MRPSTTKKATAGLSARRNLSPPELDLGAGDSNINNINNSGTAAGLVAAELDAEGAEELFDGPVVSMRYTTCYMKTRYADGRGAEKQDTLSPLLTTHGRTRTASVSSASSESGASSPRSPGSGFGGGLGGGPTSPMRLPTPRRSDSVTEQYELPPAAVADGAAGVVADPKNAGKLEVHVLAGRRKRHSQTMNKEVPYLNKVRWRSWHLGRGAACCFARWHFLCVPS